VCLSSPSVPLFYDNDKLFVTIRKEILKVKSLLLIEILVSQMVFKM